MKALIQDKKFKNVVSFTVLYRLILHLFLSPIIYYFGKKLFHYHNVQYLSTETLLFLLSKVSVWLFIIISLVVLIYLLMIELSALTLLSQYDDVSKHVLTYSDLNLKDIFKTHNLIYLPILFMVLLGFHFGMNSVISDSLFVPEFIMDTVIKTPSYLYIYLFVLVISFIVGFHLVFVFQEIFVAGKSISSAIKSSIDRVRGNRLSFLKEAVKLNLKVFISSSLIYIILLVFTGLIIYIMPPFLSFSAISVSVLFIFNKIYLFFILCFSSSMTVMFLAKQYREFGGFVPKMEFIHREEKKSKILKYSFISLVLGSLILQTFGAYNRLVLYESVDFLADKIAVTSHRGNSSVAPENTLSAIKAAKKEKADFAEIDVQLTKDEKVVVIHDFSLKRLAHDSRKVKDLTLEEIKELEVGSWFSKEFYGEKIPTLEELIDVSGNDIRLNIELKPSGNADVLAKNVVEILNEKSYSDHVVISSLNLDALKMVKSYNPDLQVGYIIPLALGMFEPDEFIDFYSLEMSFVSKNLVNRLNAQGKEVHVWTVNSEEDLKRMQALRVDNIITDDPMLARKVLSTSIIEKGILELLELLDV